MSTSTGARRNTRTQRWQQSDRMPQRRGLMVLWQIVLVQSSQSRPLCFIPLRRQLLLTCVYGPTHGKPKPCAVRGTHHSAFRLQQPLDLCVENISLSRFGRGRAYCSREWRHQTNASDRRIRRRRTKPGSLHSRERHARDARRSLALSTILLQDGLSIFEQSA